MNVGLTRAKYSLWILGKNKSLEQSASWKELLNDCEKRKLFRDVSIYTSEIFK